MKRIKREFLLLSLPGIALLGVVLLAVNASPLALESTQIHRQGKNVRVNIFFRHREPIWQKLLTASASPQWMQVMVVSDEMGHTDYALRQQIGTVESLGGNRYKTSGTFEISGVQDYSGNLILNAEIIMDSGRNRSVLPLAIPLSSPVKTVA